MANLDELESRSILIIREAYNKYKNLGMLWSLGKDSNVMVWLAKKAFFGHVPFPVIHVDTEKKFPEMYDFQKEYTKKWNLELIKEKCPPVLETDQNLPPAARSAARKTAGLKATVEKYNLSGVFAGIRRDEQAIRAKERFFSVRNSNFEWKYDDQPAELWNYFNTEFPPESHMRIHPLLEWTELDIWRYIEQENIPVVPLYFSDKNGMRYRSLGDQDITSPIRSSASNVKEIISELFNSKVSERSGRAMDHETEDAFERLRANGYM